MRSKNSDPRNGARPNNTLATKLRFFGQDETGSLTVFAFAIFMIMVIVGGLGIDVMRAEMQRTRLQNTLDRAVLAAADLDQQLDPEAVVNDYFDKMGMTDYLTSVTVDDGLNYRTVSAQASATVRTQFMQILGREELDGLRDKDAEEARLSFKSLKFVTVPAKGTAEERIANVEISMVLDISGSMRSNSKMSNLRSAAKTFVDTVITTDTQDLISLSIVPYTAQVNAGPAIFDRLNVNELHGFSHCIEFNDYEFNTTNFSTTRAYEQMQHFEAGSYRRDPITNPGCPKRSYERISAFSQNASALRSQIDSLTPRANTSIHLGMKWGVSLLDPSFQPIIQDMADDGEVDVDFANRPASYSDSETLKTVILMTDGVNVNTRRIKSWAYANDSHYAHWNRYPLYYYVNNYVGYYYRSNFYYTKYTSSQADSLLDDICDAAKDNGIVIWSIGFEVNNHGANVMKDCASSDSHFFRVEGIEITEAFAAIARQINQLRLTQ